MNIEKIINVITSQLPLILMSLNNGTSIMHLIPIIIVPLIIYVVQLYPSTIKYFRNEVAPNNYVYYNLDKTEDHIRHMHGPFITKLSLFLEKFKQKSINSGKVINYDQNDMGYGDSYLHAVININTDFNCKFQLTEKIVSKIKETGYQIPDFINIPALCKNPIYLSVSSETVTKNSGSRENSEQKSKKMDYITIAAINNRVAKDFIFIVTNFHEYDNKDTSNFILKKTEYHASNNMWGGRGSNIYMKKNFNNIFLSETNKNITINVLTQWNKNKYIQLDQGIPNKLGILLTGPPGCGKSSLIYAIAYEEKKHIVTFNFADMDNSTFMNIMSSFKNKVVVFEDIDAQKFTHKRQSDDIECDSIIDYEEFDLDTKKKDKNFKPFKSITLDVFLNVLDGYEYLNNCIVIMTSNHPEKLDPAIIRPGRMDHIIKFDLCDQFQFKDMFKYFIGIEYSHVDPSFIFTESKFTTSYIINTVILPNKNNTEKILQILM